MIPVENSKLFTQCRHSLFSWITHQVRFVVESRANVVIFYVMIYVLFEVALAFVLSVVIPKLPR